MSDSRTSFATHDVFNQPPPLVDYNLFASDRALAEGVAREGALSATDDLNRFGGALGRAETIEWGFQANRNPPVLQTFDRYGNRRDAVEFHPAWHALMALAVGDGVHTGPWADAEARRPCRARGASLSAMPDRGGRAMPAHHDLRRRCQRCGISPTSLPSGCRASIPAATMHASARRLRRPARSSGMGMTEKQGGSDLRTNSTRAEPLDGGGPSKPYRLTGHKWFFSAPMCDAFLVLAQASERALLLLPAALDAGRASATRSVIQRLKDKLGNRANASSEVEFQGAFAWLIGEEGRGVATIIEMANYTQARLRRRLAPA